MLNTIRTNFAAVLLVGLMVTTLGLSRGASAGSSSVLGEPALVAGALMLVIMLLNHVWFESGSSSGVGEAARIPL